MYASSRWRTYISPPPSPPLPTADIEDCVGAGQRCHRLTVVEHLWVVRQAHAHLVIIEGVEADINQGM